MRMQAGLREHISAKQSVLLQYLCLHTSGYECFCGLRERDSAQQSGITLQIVKNAKHGCKFTCRTGFAFGTRKTCCKSVAKRLCVLRACTQGRVDTWQPELHEQCRAIARNANAGRIARAHQCEAIRTFTIFVPAHERVRMFLRIAGARQRAAIRYHFTNSQKCKAWMQVYLQDRLCTCFYFWRLSRILNYIT